MKTIQWFPGHMAKAMRAMEDALKLVDGVIYVLDARCPASSFNAKLKQMMGSKPVLYVLNKCDLADGFVDEAVKIIESKGAKAVKLTAVNSNSRRDITGAIERLIAEKRRKNLEKGYNKTFRFLVCGVPNTGKSTVINLLASSKRAEVGDKAGVTRGKQWIRLENFELLDNPGTMPPAFANQRFAIHLAYVGSINDDILDLDDVSLCLLQELYEICPDKLKQRYGIEGGTPLEMLETVCFKRGFLLRGGECDYERAFRAVIDDFRKGKIGRISLDKRADFEDAEF